MACVRPELGFGAGLRTEHYRDIENGASGIDWYEAVTENYIDTHGRPLAVLERIRRDYPVALHGVGLSIGGADPLDRRYLARLRELARRIEPTLVTDHLCWTGVGANRVYDLLPLPYDEETLAYVTERVLCVQDALGRQIALENPSRYVAFASSTLSECEFLSALAERADCGILLDVNNVYVSAANLGFDADAYIDALPCDRIVQIHLAGFTDAGHYLFDTHSAPVHEDVWKLYARTIRRTGPVATMVEWDADVPSFARLRDEVDRARTIANEEHDATPTDVSAFSGFRRGNPQFVDPHARGFA